MFALRTKKHLTTKYSPYYLMFGREARYPSEVLEEYDVSGFSFVKAQLICSIAANRFQQMTNLQ